MASVVDPSDLKEVEETLSEQIRFINSRLVPIVSAAGADKVDKRIFKVNALGALQHRLKGVDGPELETTEIPSFERTLREFLIVDRDRVRRDKDRTTAENIEQQVAYNVNMQIDKARKPILNIDLEQATIDAQIKQLERIKINIESIIRALGAEIAESQSDILGTYLTEKLYGQLKEQVDKFDMGPLESVWTQYKRAFDALRKDENKVSKKIEIHLQNETAKLVGKHINEWRSEYLEPGLKLGAQELMKRLNYEAGEYIKVLSEIGGDERRSHEVPEEEIKKKIIEWVRDYRPAFGSVALGVTLDLGPAIAAGVIAESAYHLSVKGLTAAGIGIPVAVLLALFRKKRAKDRAKVKIVKALADNREALLMAQEVNVRQVVEDAFKNLTKPISGSIESEIAVVKANWNDLLKKRRDADFDANAFERKARAFEADIRRRASEIRRLVT